MKFGLQSYPEEVSQKAIVVGESGLRARRAVSNFARDGNLNLVRIIIVARTMRAPRSPCNRVLWVYRLSPI